MEVSKSWRWQSEGSGLWWNNSFQRWAAAPSYNRSPAEVHLAVKSFFLIISVLCVSTLLQAASPAPIKIRIEANQWNRGKLLEKLNQNGASHGMMFILAGEAEAYEYRIVFRTGKTSEAVVVNGTGGTADYDTGFAVVYDSHGEEMFQISHEAWLNETAAINGIAKDIVKRLKKMRASPQKK